MKAAGVCSAPFRKLLTVCSPPSSVISPSSDSSSALPHSHCHELLCFHIACCTPYHPPAATDVLTDIDNPLQPSPSSFPSSHPPALLHPTPQCDEHHSSLSVLQPPRTGDSRSRDHSLSTVRLRASIDARQPAAWTITHTTRIGRLSRHRRARPAVTHTRAARTTRPQMARQPPQTHSSHALPHTNTHRTIQHFRH